MQDENLSENYKNSLKMNNDLFEDVFKEWRG